ncbi:MAG TPA: hypothetical protein VMD04_05005, partial [Candidatus Margulisiibacteriota bacterium]|nr:hypothetical protein [Candidatus Margulisiibacteriota bacterium]
VNTLEAKVKELTQHALNLEGIRAALIQKSDHLAGQLSASLKEIEELGKQIASLEKERSKLKAENKDLKAANSDMAAQVNTLEAKVKELTQHALNLEGIRAALIQKSDHLAGQLSASLKEIEELNNEKGKD